MGWIVTIIIGILAGWIAEKVMKRDHGLLMNLGVGLIGALIGNAIASALGIAAGGFIMSVIFAAIGACILLFVVGLVMKKT